jgi:transposase InsO family protein
MEKEVLGKEFFKLKNSGFSYAVCKRVLRSQFGEAVSVRTLKRWVSRLDAGDWDLCDKSRKPHRIHHKICPAAEQQVISLRKQTGWGCNKIASHSPEIGLSAMSINTILRKHSLCRESKSKRKRRKWVRWQRNHPNSLWQIDHTDEQDLFNCYTLSVMDDCSRYSLALVKLNNVTTDVVTHILDELIKKHGKPKQILTDNGSAYGQKSKHSRFDRWCNRKRNTTHQNKGP